MAYSPKLVFKQHWIAELGCRGEDLEKGVTVVRAHGTLKGYNGVMLLKHRDTCVVSAPHELVSFLSEKLNGRTAEESFDAALLMNLLGDKAEKFIGPAWLAHIAQENYRPCHDDRAREIGDWVKFDNFLAACPAAEVDLSSLQSGRVPTVGIFENQEIVCASGYELKGNAVAHIGILTRPDRRGLGYARQAISAIAQTAMLNNLGIQYWTHGKNAASIRAAAAVGFDKFGETIAIRLR